MPQNKRESLIYTILMCFCMVFWMSMYNVFMHTGQFSIATLQEGWMGFPFAYIFAMICDWCIVSGPAKKIRISFSGDSGKFCDQESNRGILQYGGPNGNFDVTVRRTGNVCSHRSMEPPWNDLAYKHSKELYYGSAIPAADCRTAG